LLVSRFAETSLPIYTGCVMTALVAVFSIIRFQTVTKSNKDAVDTVDVVD